MSGWNGWYANDGSMNVTVVSSSTLTGLMAADGSVNVTPSPGVSFVGTYSPGGSLWVTLQGSSVSSRFNTDGSLNVSVSSYPSGQAQHITVVGGSFSTTYTPLSIVLTFGY